VRAATEAGAKALAEAQATIPGDEDEAMQKRVEEALDASNYGTG
jgi:hypothetical protein